MYSTGQCAGSGHSGTRVMGRCGQYWYHVVHLRVRVRVRVYYCSHCSGVRSGFTTVPTVVVAGPVVSVVTVPGPVVSVVTVPGPVVLLH